MNPMRGQAAASTVVRRQDCLYVLNRVMEGDCCAVVGVSNTGKSSLLRALASPQTRCRLIDRPPDASVHVYVDFNLMLEATEQGFYELLLRCLIAELARLDPSAECLPELRSAYKTLVAPPTAFQVALSFREGLTAVCHGVDRKLILLLDEFDEPFEQLEGRTYLNLRALKDEYGGRLSYVTATNQRLSSIRRGREVDEFLELFEPFTRFLAPLDREDIDRVVAGVAAQEGYTFGEEDHAFVSHHADGHLGLLLSISRALGAVTGQPVRDAGQDWLIHRQVREQLDRDVNVQAECRKLWEELTEAQREALMAVAGSGEEVDAKDLELLRLKGLVAAEDERVFSPVFEGFVRRQRLTRRLRHEGVRVDVESGNVWVDGKQCASLTDLEYRLLLQLYGRLNLICDKYQIVEAVWGEEYIDEVDDARIDKLLSRLRAKIEADSSNPRYLLTVRGRGYKLVGP